MQHKQSKEIQKQEKLNDLQNKHRTLLLDRIPLQKEYKTKTRNLNRLRVVLGEKSAEIKDVGERIYTIKHGGATPHVTDHAIVRYLERVEGIDIWELKTKVASNKNAVKEGNVIVTVNQDIGVEK